MVCFQTFGSTKLPARWLQEKQSWLKHRSGSSRQVSLHYSSHLLLLEWWPWALFGSPEQDYFIFFFGKLLWPPSCPPAYRATSGKHLVHFASALCVQVCVLRQSQAWINNSIFCFHCSPEYSCSSEARLPACTRIFPPTYSHPGL